MKRFNGWDDVKRNSTYELSVGGKIDVWSFGLDSIHGVIAGFDCSEELEEAELLKADGFSNSLLRNRYVACRLWVRFVLAKYLSCKCQNVRIAYSPYGKPYLPGSRLAFNLSHSGERALLCVGKGSELGIDIEEIVEVEEAELIASRCFSGEERRGIREAEKPLEAFMQCWVRHEAVHKAIGMGLSLAMESVKVPFLQAGMGRVRHEGKVWRVEDLILDDGYAAAISWFEGQAYEYV